MDSFIEMSGSQISELSQSTCTKNLLCPAVSLRQLTNSKSMAKAKAAKAKRSGTLRSFLALADSSFLTFAVGKQQQ